jgi:hypothetical protein
VAAGRRVGRSAHGCAMNSTELWEGAACARRGEHEDLPTESGAMGSAVAACRVRFPCARRESGPHHTALAALSGSYAASHQNARWRTHRLHDPVAGLPLRRRTRIAAWSRGDDSRTCRGAEPTRSGSTPTNLPRTRLACSSQTGCARRSRPSSTSDTSRLARCSVPRR